ncbi:amidohydrolase family protein [Reichenbachiella sp.]|uniref:amidohydrolase family protein n=1 Tax=Reichenbachiella sp. TaxID=2184521 RepID=UPI003BB1BF33
MKTLLLYLILIFSLRFSAIGQADSTVNYVFLKNATIIDVVSDTGKKGSLLIKEDRIAAIDFTNSLAIPKGAVTYDLEGKYIIPGLIDAHVHITHGTLKEAQAHLYTALKKGITGVRDMGGDGRMLTLLQKNMKIGEDTGPDVFFSTIIAGPEFFEQDPRPQQVAKGAIAGEVSWLRAITHESDLRQIVAEAKGLGATAIKVYLNVDKDLFKKVSDEAKKQGLKVWSHAVVPPTKAINITNGGSDVMSHAGHMVQYEFANGDLRGRHSFDSKDKANAYRKKMNDKKWNENTKEVKQLFTAMKNNNSILDATLFIYTFRLDPKANAEVDSTMYHLGMKTVKTAYKYQVKIGAGSDHMISEDGTINIHKELELLTTAGLSNIDALRAATIVNAEGLGEEKNMGTIEKGKLANLVILNSDPLAYISNTKDIKYVFKRGEKVE